MEQTLTFISIIDQYSGKSTSLIRKEKKISGIHMCKENDNEILFADGMII